MTHAVRLFSLDQDSDRRRARIALKGDYLRDYKRLQKMMRTAFESAVGNLAMNPQRIDKAIREALPDDWLSRFTIVEEETYLIGCSKKGVVKRIEEYDADLKQYAAKVEKATKEFGLRW